MQQVSERERPEIPGFVIAGGSVIGAEHRRCGRGGQDAYAWRQGARSLVAVVCDGCGSGRHSEVGAKVGARIVAEALSRRLEAGASLADPELWQRVRLETLAHLRLLALAMGGCTPEIVGDYLLFTVVGAAVTPTLTVVFSLGDGVIAVNGERSELGPFADNKPPYLAYGLLPGTRPQLFNLDALLPTREVSSIVLATDGATELDAAGLPLAGLADCDALFRNRDALRRKLALLVNERTSVDWQAQRVDRQGGKLSDDTTVIAIRRGVVG